MDNNMDNIDFTKYSDGEGISQNVEMRNHHFYSSSYDVREEFDPDNSHILNS